MRGELIDLQKQRTNDALDFSGFMLITALLANHIEFIEEEQAALAAGLCKELGEPQGGFAKETADEAFIAHHQ